MSQLLPGSTATADVVSALSPAAGAASNDPTQVLTLEREVLLATAAAISVSPARTGRRRLSATLNAAIGRVLKLSKPRRHYARREPNYLESARMSRAMQRL